MTLHVYAQSCEHDEAYIVGTRDDLVKLRNAIDSALGAKAKHRSSDSVEPFFDAAGEGYDLYVKVVPAVVENNLTLPYAELIGRSLGRAEETPELVPTE
jgi:hypothetical protein